MTTIPYLTPRVVAALRKQNDSDGKGGWKAKIGVDDVALLLNAAEALPALTERVKAAEREAARLRKGMLEVPPKIATAMGDEVARLRAELAAVRTLHTDKIIAFDALAAKVAAASKLADWYDAQPNWREWRIGASIRAALDASETP